MAVSRSGDMAIPSVAMPRVEYLPTCMAILRDRHITRHIA